MRILILLATLPGLHKIFQLLWQAPMILSAEVAEVLHFRNYIVVMPHSLTNVRNYE